ncbi:MAG TPA: hypothetical protein VF756_17090 [Thermoanaerobaculia bacterium]
MSRTRRIAVLFLLALAIALPSLALPAPERAEGKGLLAALWERLAPVLGLFERSRSSADPDGGSPTTGETPSASSADDGDSRSGADPDG